MKHGLQYTCETRTYCSTTIVNLEHQTAVYLVWNKGRLQYTCETCTYCSTLSVKQGQIAILLWNTEILQYIQCETKADCNAVNVGPLQTAVPSVKHAANCKTLWDMWEHSVWNRYRLLYIQKNKKKNTYRLYCTLCVYCSYCETSTDWSTLLEKHVQSQCTRCQTQTDRNSLAMKEWNNH